MNKKIWLIFVGVLDGVCRHPKTKNWQKDEGGLAP
jgi:hypothetical protein